MFELAPLDVQIERLHVAMSDPDAWSIDLETYTLVSSTGVQLNVRHDVNFMDFSMTISYTDATSLRGSLESVVSTFDVEKLWYLHERLKVFSKPSNLYARLSTVYCKGLGHCKRTLALALHMWQATLRLHCTAAGRAVHQAVQADLMVGILQAINGSAYPSHGHWQLFSTGMLVHHTEGLYSKALHRSQVHAMFARVLDLGYPIKPMHLLDFEPKHHIIYATDSLWVDIPDSAHAKAKILSQARSER